MPTAVAVFQDGDIAIRKYGEGANNIVRWTEYPHGGHYAAMTVPEEWLKDVREFFRGLRHRLMAVVIMLLNLDNINGGCLDM